MRPHYLFPVAALMALASSAGAQTPAAPAADAESISSVQVKAPVRAMRIRDDQARQITGSYGMSNGWYLKVHTEPRYIVARIDNDAPIRLYAVAPYKFVSQDARVAMEFNRGAGGEDMLMSYVPQTGLARVELASSPLAQR